MQVKTARGLYPKKFIEGHLEEAPGGVRIVLTGKAPNEVPLMSIRYKYSQRKTLLFVCTQDAGHTREGTPYEMKLTDLYGYVCVRYMKPPQVILCFFTYSNILDKNNHLGQYELALENKWPTQHAYFRLYTTMQGICTTDCYNLCYFHNFFTKKRSAFSDDNEEFHVTVKSFAGIVVKQIMNYADNYCIVNTHYKGTVHYFVLF